jgi:hypothetical protein
MANILVGMEFSGVISESFAKLGHNVWSADFLPKEYEGKQLAHHYQGNVLDIIGEKWDLAIFHPTCQYLCSSGLHWNKRVPGRAEKTEEAVEFVKLLMNLDIPRIAIENPIGILSTRIRKPDQIIQPYMFGHDASKSTCLFLKNLPLLKPTNYIEPRIVNGKKRWANQTDSGQNRLGPSADRWKLRSITPTGLGEAMAYQWGHL